MIIVRLQSGFHDEIEAARGEAGIGVGVEAVARDAGGAAEAFEDVRFGAGEEIGIGGGEPGFGQ